MATPDSTQTTPAPRKPSAHSGFFQLSLDRLLKIPGHVLNPALDSPPMGADEMLAYIGCAGGVDSKKAEARASTHGSKSIAAHVMMSVSRADAALERLQRAGFLQRQTSTAILSPERKRVVGDITWQIDPDHPCDIAISQEFLQAPDLKQPASSRFKTETLAHLRENIEIAEGISASCATIDALAVFFSLHKHLDFDLFGGVDPNVARGNCSPITDGEDGDSSQHIKPVKGAPNFIMISVSTPSEVAYSQNFIAETLGPLPTWTDAPSLSVRFAHAVRQLRKSGLIYNALVVWDSCPVDRLKNSRPEPIATLYLPSRRDERMEHRLSDATHSAMLKTGTMDAPETFPHNNDFVPRWSNSGIYRYVVPKYQAHTAKLLLQIRVRRWAYSAVNVTGLHADQARLRRQEAMLKDLVEQTLATPC